MLSLRTRTLILVLALAVLAPAQAQAIIGGQPDGTAHPFVGLVTDKTSFCSGTLLAPTIFLTSAHCFPATGSVAGQPFADVEVSFDPSVNIFTPPISTFVTGRWYPDPQACLGCANGLPGADSHDVAVVVLDSPVASPTYGQLPSPFLVDSLPTRTTDTIVGYGVRGFARGGGPPRPTGIQDRYAGTAQLIQGNGVLSPQFLKVSANNAQGKAGICFGDSGGPNFLGSTTTVLGVNALVTNSGCNGVTYAFRIDTPSALAFIRSAAATYGGVVLP